MMSFYVKCFRSGLGTKQVLSKWVHAPSAHSLFSSLDPFQSPSARASWTLCVRTASSACFTPWFVTGSSSAAMALMKMQLLRDAVSGAGGGGNLQSRKTPQGDGPPWGCTSIQVTGLDCVSSLAFYEEGLRVLLQK